METTYRIGYIDEDEKQVRLYKRKLRKFGFDVIGYDCHKGMTLEELMAQVYNSEIDLLMIDFRLNESNILSFNGEEVERQIYENKPLLPRIIFTNKVDQAEPKVDDLKIVFDKEDVFPSDNEDENPKTKRFIDILTKSIEQYKKRINNRKELISRLLEKERTEGLTFNEKNTLLSIHQELYSLDKTIIPEIPKTLMSVESLDQINKARQDAEAFIESLLSNDENERKK